MAASLDDLVTKVETGEPLSDADVDALAGSRDIISLGMMASTVRRKIHGSDVTFVRVADLKLDDLEAADSDRKRWRSSDLSDAVFPRCRC